jgi:hypothetical protein
VSVLENISRSAGLRYLLVGSYLSAFATNEHIADGGVFNINLLAAPFSLPQPVDVFHEANNKAAGLPKDDKSLLLFAAADLRSVSWTAMRTRAEEFARAQLTKDSGPA